MDLAYYLAFPIIYFDVRYRGACPFKPCLLIYFWIRNRLGSKKVLIMKITTTNFSIFLITVLTVALIAMTVYTESDKDKVKHNNENAVAASAIVR